MNLLKKDEHIKYVVKKFLNKNEQFNYELYKFIMKNFQDIDQILSSTQLNGLKKKINEIDLGKSQNRVEVFFDFIDKQIGKDKNAKSWNKLIVQESLVYGRLIKKKYNKFEKKLLNNLETMFVDKKSCESLTEYHQNNPEQFSFLLLTRFIEVFTRVELYGKEAYQEIIKGGKITWDKI